MIAPAALAALEPVADPARATGMAAYHEAPRRYLGLALPTVEPLVAGWRAALDVAGRVAPARGLWDSDVHFIQKAVGGWLRTLSVRDPARVAAFLDGPGRSLKPFARREATRRMARPAADRRLSAGLRGSAARGRPRRRGSGGCAANRGRRRRRRG